MENWIVNFLFKDDEYYFHINTVEKNGDYSRYERSKIFKTYRVTGEYGKIDMASLDLLEKIEERYPNGPPIGDHFWPETLL